VEETPDCTNSQAINPAIVTAFETCMECTPPGCYILTDCTNTIPAFPVSAEGLDLTPGSVVQIETFPGVCFSVSDQIPGCSGVVVEITATFPDCECCLPPPEPEPEPPVQRARVSFERSYYRVEEDQCAIETNQQFGSSYYELFKSLKYGVQGCEVDLGRIWIKKQLLDIRAKEIEYDCSPGTGECGRCLPATGVQVEGEIV